jgi:rare lipoprotein A
MFRLMRGTTAGEHGTEWLGRLRAAFAIATIAMLAGCASGPARFLQRDGPEANPPPDLARVPDAEPKLEAIRPGGANKPYEVLGKNYVPLTQDAPYTERGLASWYGRKFNGKPTASGEIYNMYAMTAAHPTLPIPSYARIRNPANGREVVVRINDRGPFHSNRIVDLSYTAALKLDLLRGVAPVELQRITFDEIRTGAWRRAGDEPVVAAAGAQGAAAVPVPSAIVEPVVATADTASTTTAPPPDVNTPPPAIADAPVARAFTAPARGFWVQLGAFRARDGAESFHQRVSAELDWLSPLLAVFNDASIYRLQAGPYPSREEARGVAERVRSNLQLVPVIVERR